MLYWISWVQPTPDDRPINYPPHRSIIGWWCTGYTEVGSTLCAMVLADSEDNAREVVLIEWPEATAWRFCDERRDATFSDRWRISDWMVQRIDALSSNSIL
jgi:hypothetical protein